MRIVDNYNIDTASQQKSRLCRIATTGAGICLHFMVCWAVYSAGYLNIRPLQFVALMAIAGAGFLAFFLTIVMEWNLGLEDPDLSLAHMIWAVSIVILTTWFAGTMKPLVALSGLALIVAGANRLTARELLLFVVYGLAVYIASVVYQSRLLPVSWLTQLLAMLAFGLVLIFAPLLYRFEMSIVESALAVKNRELAEALDHVRDLTVTDALTGAFNRRHLLQFLTLQKAIADRRADYDFAVCCMDLDHFHRVNDSFGSVAGDRLLRSFAGIVADVLREVDCVARIGGEQFMLVLGGTRQQDAVVAAERVFGRLQALQVSPHEPHYRVTASMGITEYRRSEDVEMTMDRAGKALRSAKRTGRNRVVIADSDREVVTGWR